MAAPAFPPFVPGASPLAVTSVADIEAVAPAWMLQSENRPVTDALFAALLAIILDWQHRAGYAAAQADTLRSTAEYLDGLGADRGIPRGTEETDPNYRPRIYTFPDMATGFAIRLAVDAILAPYTSTGCQLSEDILDRLFIEPQAGAVWRSFIGRNPEYPTRLYESNDAANGGSIPQNEPGGALIYGDSVGRRFLLRVPDLAGLNEAPAAIYSSAELGNPEPRLRDVAMHIGDGSNATAAAFLTGGTATAESVYQAIVGMVDQIKGHSMRWILMSDPSM